MLATLYDANQEKLKKELNKVLFQYHDEASKPLNQLDLATDYALFVLDTTKKRNYSGRVIG